MIPLLEPEILIKSKQYVKDCLDSGWLSYTGPYVKKLEDNISDFTKTKKAIATSTGTGGLWLALKTLGVGPGDFVVVPTMTFVATVNAVIHVGATPVFVDCDDDLQMSTKYLKEVIDVIKPKAVIPVHMLGNMCDMPTIQQICKEGNVEYIIEDAAQALGSYNDTDYAGTIGTVGMYSFSFNKLIAAGQGGMLVTNNIDLGNKLKYMSLQAKDDAEMYLHSEAGFNMGMSNINAALAYGQIESIWRILKEKRNVRDTYLNLISKEKMYYQKGGNGWLNAYRSKRTYKDISKDLKELGIQTRPLFYPNHLQKSFTQYSYFGEDLALQKYNSTICIPSSSSLTDEQIEFVVKSIKHYDK